METHEESINNSTKLLELVGKEMMHEALSERTRQGIHQDRARGIAEQTEGKAHRHAKQGAAQKIEKHRARDRKRLEIEITAHVGQQYPCRLFGRVRMQCLAQVLRCLEGRGKAHVLPLRLTQGRDD